MTIEFSCQHCGKALSTSDDKAGRKAKCPGCGEAVLVPAPVSVGDGADDLDYGGDSDLDAVGEDVTCPMCGAKNASRAKTCESCGEPLKTRGSRSRSPQSIEAGDVVSTSWRIFKLEMGTVIGGVIVAGIINGASGLPQGLLNGIATAMRENGDQQTAAVLQMIGLCVMPVAYLVQWFITCGLNIMLLKVARGEPAGLGDLFSGGRYLWRMAGSTILFVLMVVLGLICLIIPGIIVSLMFSPYSYVLVDEDPPGVKCLWRAKEYTSGNLGAIFVLGFAVFGINILGFCALVVGLVFTIPLTSLMIAVAYCKMSGQRTVA